MRFRSFFLFLLIVSTSVHSIDVRLRPLYSEHIHDYEKKIATEIKQLHYIRRSFELGLLGMTTYLGYRWLGNSSANSTSHTMPLATGDLNAEILAKLNQKIDEDSVARLHLFNFLADHGYPITPQSWGEWTSGWMRWFGSQAFIITVGIVISNSINPFMKYFKAFDAKVDEAINKIYFKPTIHWFLTSRCSLNAIFGQLESNATQFAQVNNPQIDEYQLASFITQWNLFTQQLESLIGFMRYQSGYDRNPELKYKKQLLIQEITEFTEKTKNTIEQAILNNRNQIFDFVLTLKNKINGYIAEYSILESLNLY